MSNNIPSKDSEWHTYPSEAAKLTYFYGKHVLGHDVEFSLSAREQLESNYTDLVVQVTLIDQDPILGQTVGSSWISDLREIEKCQKNHKGAVIPYPTWREKQEATRLKAREAEVQRNQDVAEFLDDEL